MLLAEGALRSDIAPEEAADILGLLVLPSTYRRLVTQGGWTDERFSEWLGQTICTLLFKPVPVDLPTRQRLGQPRRVERLDKSDAITFGT